MRETLYGRHAVCESLRAVRRHAYRLVMAKGTVQTTITEEIISLAQAHKVRVDTVSRAELARIAGTDQHQGVALETSQYPYTSVDDMLDLEALQAFHQDLELALVLVDAVYATGGANAVEILRRGVFRGLAVGQQDAQDLVLGLADGH